MASIVERELVVGGDGVERQTPTGERPPFSVGAARALVKDLFVHKPHIYWIDFLVSMTIGYAAGAYYLLAPLLSIGQFVALFIGGFALFRVGSFIHEIVHFRRGEMNGFTIGWNLLAGVPLLMPSSFYENHIDHHNNRHYGTRDDGEYLPLGGGPLMQVLWYFLQALVLPVLVVVRFVLFTPISFLHPRLRKWVRERSSSYAMNYGYRREDMSGRTPAFWLLVEIACFFRAALIFALIGVGLMGIEGVRGNPPHHLLLLYVMALFTLGLNYIRNLTAHRYRNHGPAMTHEEQLRDSITITGGWLTELFFPLALRYHALHHLFPHLPYHNLRAAHDRIVAHFSPDSSYHQTIFPSYAAAVRELVKNSREACQLSPTASEKWYATPSERGTSKAETAAS